jgi:hypothetical protein
VADAVLQVAVEGDADRRAATLTVERNHRAVERVAKHVAQILKLTDLAAPVFASTRPGAAM